MRDDTPSAHSDEGDQSELRVDIERRSESTVIRIRDVETKSFDVACMLADRLFRRALLFERKSDAQRSLAPLWIGKEPDLRISDAVTQSTHRLALALFRAYPGGKKADDLTKEAGLSRSVAYAHLSRLHETAGYFEVDSGQWKLTETGFEWVLREIVPFLADQTGLVRANE